MSMSNLIQINIGIMDMKKHFNLSFHIHVDEYGKRVK